MGLEEKDKKEEGNKINEVLDLEHEKMYLVPNVSVRNIPNKRT